LTLGTPFVTNADVTGTAVAHDPSQGGWVLDVTLNAAAANRLAARPVLSTIAIVLDDAVLSTPPINPGISGTEVQVADHLTQAAAVAMARRILGRPPDSVDGAASGTTIVGEPAPDYAALMRYLLATKKPKPGFIPITEAFVRQTYTAELFVCSSAAQAAQHFPTTSARETDYVAMTTFLCGHDFAQRVIAAIPGITAAARTTLLTELAQVEKYRR
jgi:hypothetical protein